MIEKLLMNIKLKRMKKLFLMISASLMIAFSYGQTNFKWEKVDSVAKSKDQIYTDSKMFIAEFWKSAQNVIQNDDKQGGLILVKGASIQSKIFQLVNHTWTFSYTIKFMMKENKYRIVIEDVYCSSARCAQNEWPYMPVADTYPSEKGLRITGVNEERYLEIMGSLKQELQSIADGYNTYIKKLSSSNNDW